MIFFSDTAPLYFYSSIYSTLPEGSPKDELEGLVLKKILLNFIFGPSSSSSRQSRYLQGGAHKIFLLCGSLLLTNPMYGITMNNFYKDLNVVVTGGCGFIGSHLATTLVELGAHVTIIDDLSTGTIENIATIKDKITFINKSIVDKQACLEATKDAAIIFHLAAFISVPQSLEQPEMCHATNVDGLVHILEAARINGVGRLVFSSSSAVYGNNEGACAEDSLTNPESPYGYSKLIGELYCQQYAKNFGINAVICRYFNVYGERQNPNGAYAAVIAKFMHQLKNNLPMTIFGDGLQTRDFIPVAQVVQANLKLGMLAPTIAGQVFNIATGKSITLLALVDQLKKDFPTYHNPLNFAPARAGDLKYSTANCAKYYRAIASLPYINL